MLRLFSFLFLLAITSVGCTEAMVGGNCEYETLIGTALIQREQDDVLARFFPAGKGFAESEIRFSSDMKFQVRQPVDSERSDVLFPAQLSAITQGSCTPYRFDLLSSEYFSRGIFLAFNDEGQMNAAAQTELEELATIFQRLNPIWPKLKVDLCGQTARQGTEEYNMVLADRYAHQISRILEQQKVPGSQIHIASGGETPCPRSYISDGEVGHGVWVRFMLTGFDLLSEDDLDAANNGDRTVQQKLLEMVNAESTSTPDKKLAAQWVVQAAQKVNPAAQYALGVAYLWGNGVASDMTSGVDWINTAAYNDYPPAQRELGWMYFHGDIIEQDHARAYAWFLLAAENGDSEAMHEVQEYEKYVETALEYSMKDLEAGKAINQALKKLIKVEQPL